MKQALTLLAFLIASLSFLALFTIYWAAVIFVPSTPGDSLIIGAELCALFTVLSFAGILILPRQKTLLRSLLVSAGIMLLGVAGFVGVSLIMRGTFAGLMSFYLVTGGLAVYAWRNSDQLR